MTKEEFFERYQDALVRFDDYYKYTFTFAGVGSNIRFHIGGDADEIYRLSVTPEIVPLSDVICDPEEIIFAIIDGSEVVEV